MTEFRDDPGRAPPAEEHADTPDAGLSLGGNGPGGDDLAGKYLTKDGKKLDTSDPSDAKVSGVITLVFGAGTIVLGVCLLGRPKGRSYFGALVVTGIAIIVEGLYCLIARVRYDKIPKRFHIAVWAVVVVACFAWILVCAGKGTR